MNDAADFRHFVLCSVERPQAGFWLEAGGTLSGRGWAIARTDIVEIAVYLGEEFLCYATHGLPRPDIARNFAGYDMADHAGFAFSVPVDRRLAQRTGQELVVRLRTLGGAEVTRIVPSAALPPPGEAAPEPSRAAAGADAWPIRLAIDEARIDGQGLLRLHGWVVSLTPLAAVHAFLGDVALNEPQRNIRRPDIAAAHPNYPNAATAGFRLVQDTRALGASHSVIRVQAVSATGIRRQVMTALQTLPPSQQVLLQDQDLNVCCDEFSLRADGSLVVAGWALAATPVAAVEISLDGAPLGRAELGLRRPDIGNRFPRHAEASRSGFQFAHQTGQAIAGEHQLALRIRTEGGISRDMELPLAAEALGQSRQSVDDVLAGAGEAIKLHIDSPGLSGDRASLPLRGMLTVSGWAVARGGIDRVEIWLDEQKLGDAYLGMRREDVGAAFPDFDGALLSGFVMTVPHRAVSPGEHGIRVLARARSGRSSERGFQLVAEPPDLSGLGAIRHFVPQAETAQRLALLGAAGARPAHLVLVCAAGQGSRAIQATLDSLRRQTYPDWQAILWIADSAVPAPTADAMLDGRIRLHHAPQPPAWLSDRAGSHVLLSAIMAGDRLGADALLELAVEAARGKGADFVYADERRRDVATGTIQPWFKPAWSPELLLATDYIGHAWCATATLVRIARLTPGELMAHGNHHAVLRLTELARGIGHVPRVLYERSERHAEADPAQQRGALQAAIARRGRRAQVQPGLCADSWHIDYALDEMPLVSVIIPTCAAGGLIERAMATLRRTDYPAIEIIAIDNIPDDKPDWKAWLRRHADRVVDLPGAFNWSHFNNQATRVAQGRFLLFLNDDIEAPDPSWLRHMVAQAQRREVGVVGARLLYPNGTVQHAGMFLSGVHGVHAFRFLGGSEPGPFGLAVTQRETTAVTGACMLMRRGVFDALGGFEAAHSVVNNDLDFCLRAGAAGLRVVYAPQACLVHHELASRATLPDTFDEARFQGAWRMRFLAGDPLFNPNLTAGSTEYLPDSEPVETLHAGHPLIAAADVRRILVVKLDHIGDFLTGLPALRRLRQHFPQAEITLLAARASLLLAPLEPAIDHVLEFNFFRAKSSEGTLPLGPVEIELLQAELARRHFDIAVDFRMHPDTRQILRHSGARLLAGFDVGGRFPWLDVALEWEGDMRLLSKRAHVTDRLLGLADALGNACLPDRATLAAPPPVNRTEVAAQLAQAGADAAFLARRLVCVHPAAGNAMKQWPAQSYAGLIDLLVERHDVSVLLIGSAEDAAIVAEVLEQATHRAAVLSLAGRVPLAELAGVLAACTLYVGNDSGPKHLAAALGLPTVGVHSGNIDAAEWGPLGPRAVAVRKRVACSPCYLSQEVECSRGVVCLRGIRVQDVYRACAQFIMNPDG